MRSGFHAHTKTRANYTPDGASKGRGRRRLAGGARGGDGCVSWWRALERRTPLPMKKSHFRHFRPLVPVPPPAISQPGQIHSSEFTPRLRRRSARLLDSFTPAFQMLFLVTFTAGLDRVNTLLKGVSVLLPDISVDESGVSVSLTSVVCTDLSVRRLEVARSSNASTSPCTPSTRQ